MSKDRVNTKINAFLTLQKEMHTGQSRREKVSRLLFHRMRRVRARTQRQRDTQRPTQMLQVFGLFVCAFFCSCGSFAGGGRWRPRESLLPNLLRRWGWEERVLRTHPRYKNPKTDQNKGQLDAGGGDVFHTRNTGKKHCQESKKQKGCNRKKARARACARTLSQPRAAAGVEVAVLLGVGAVVGANAADAAVHRPRRPRP